jgi:hypothetical protein
MARSYFVERDDIDSLDFLHFLDFLDDLLNRNLVLNDTSQDQFLYSVSDIFLFAFAPGQSLTLDLVLDPSLDLAEVSFCSFGHDSENNQGLLAA